MGKAGHQEECKAQERMKDDFFVQILAPWQKAEYIGKARDQKIAGIGKSAKRFSLSRVQLLGNSNLRVPRCE